MQNYYGWPPPPNYMGAPQAPNAPVMYIPVPMGKDGKAPKPKNIIKQLKEWQEFQKMMKGEDKKEEKKKDEAPKISMSPLTALMWLLALSPIVGAFMVFAVYLPLGKMIVNSIK